MQAGSAFQKLWPARGLAVGDYDNDGGIDVLVCNNGCAPVLLKNNAAKANNWLGLKLQGITCNRDAIGARIYWTAGGKRRFRLKNNGGSYLSSHDPREILGIGTASKIDTLEIHWPSPSAAVDTFKQVPLNRYVEIVEGHTKQLK
jgi:enediyne biosynthesis protein E4